METYVAALGVQNARDPDTANGGAPFHWERIRVKGLALGYAFEKIRLRGEGPGGRATFCQPTCLPSGRADAYFSPKRRFHERRCGDLNLMLSAAQLVPRGRAERI
jgi:hypothetical protein